MIKARIKKDDHSGYWLLIDHDDKIEDVAMALTEDEILPIRDAIDEYILKESK